MLGDASDAQDTGAPGLEIRAEDLGCNLHPGSGATHPNAQNKSACVWRFTNSLLAALPLLWLRGRRFRAVCRQCFQVPFPSARFAGHDEALQWL